MKKKIALVLSSGGARGLAHIGVIEALEKNGYQIQSVAGSSIGALVGGFYAAGKLDIFKEWICNLSKREVFQLMDFTFSSKGLIKGEKMFRKMQELMEDIHIEDLEIPFSAVAVDVHDHTEHVFRQGSLFQAIRASVAIPTIIKPCFIDGKEYVDGGVVNPIPIRHVEKKESDLLVVVNVNARTPYQSENVQSVPTKNDRYNLYDYVISRWLKFSLSSRYKPKRSSLLGLLGKSIELMQEQLTDLTLAQHEHDVLVNVSKKVCNIFEFHRASELVEQGEKALIESIQQNKMQKNISTHKLAG